MSDRQPVTLTPAQRDMIYESAEELSHPRPVKDYDWRVVLIVIVLWAATFAVGWWISPLLYGGK
jgi:hypothetical protein